MNYFHIRKHFRAFLILYIIILKFHSPKQKNHCVPQPLNKTTKDVLSPKAARNLPEGCPKAARNLPVGCPKADAIKNLVIHPSCLHLFPSNVNV